MSSTVLPSTPEDIAVNKQRDEVEQLILVDEQDREIGLGEKLAVHQRGQLHRAFSILIFDTQDRLLLQRRADYKYHFARLWTNTCCSHPRPDESISDAAKRRLQEEFGFQTSLTKLCELIYRAEDKDSGLTEHEYLYVFWGRFNGVPEPDRSEIGAWRWLSLPAVERAIEMHSEWFTPWFKLLMQRLKPYLADKMQA